MTRNESPSGKREEQRKMEQQASRTTGMETGGMFMTGSAGFSRPPLARMLRLHELLAANRYPNCRKLADEFEVSPKTIQRDINFMRDRLRLPIDYDEALFGFRYTRMVPTFPANIVPAREARRKFSGAFAFPQFFPPPAEIAPPAAGHGRLPIRIVFDAVVAPAIREREWHPSQEIVELADGRIEFSMHLDSFSGIERWILSWGAHACVVEPDRLRRRIMKIARAILS